MGLKRRMRDALPETIRPYFRNAYHIAHPHRSYLERVREDARTAVVNDRFLQRFLDGDFETDVHSVRALAVKELFDDTEEYERYESEFESGPIYDILGSASGELDGENWFYDSHTGPSKLYYTLVRKYEPEVLVETGVHNGISTLAILIALAENGTGKLYSIHDPDSDRDRDPEECKDRDWVDVLEDGDAYSRARPSSAEIGSAAIPEGLQPGWVIPDEYRTRWELLSGSSAEQLPGLLNTLDHVDFFLHDSDRTAPTMGFEFVLAWHNLSPGGFICSHHVGWNTIFGDFVQSRESEHGILTYHAREGTERPVPSCTGFVRKPDNPVDPSSDRANK